MCLVGNAGLSLYTADCVSTKGLVIYAFGLPLQWRQHQHSQPKIRYVALARGAECLLPSISSTGPERVVTRTCPFMLGRLTAMWDAHTQKLAANTV